MKLSFTTYTIGIGKSLDELIAMAKSSGCAGIEFRTDGNHGHGIERSLDAEGRRAARRKMEDAYLETVSIATGCSFHDEGKRGQMIADAVEACRLAADLSCPRIRVFGNIIPEGVESRACVEAVGDALAEVADAAAPLGVDVLLEMHGQFNLPAYALGALKRAGRANVGLIYNCDQRDIVYPRSVRETLVSVLPYVRHIHMHDYDGRYPYAELFALLAETGYEDFMSAEIESSGAGAESAEYIMKMYAECFRAYRALALG